MNERLSGLSETSEKYQEVANEIALNDEAIQACEMSQIEWNKAITNIPLERLQRQLELLESINALTDSEMDLKVATGVKLTEADYAKEIAEAKDALEVKKSARTETAIRADLAGRGTADMSDEAWLSLYRDDLVYAMQKMGMGTSEADIAAELQNIRSKTSGEWTEEFNQLKVEENNLLADIAKAERESSNLAIHDKEEEIAQQQNLNDAYKDYVDLKGGMVEESDYQKLIDYAEVEKGFWEDKARLLKEQRSVYGEGSTEYNDLTRQIEEAESQTRSLTKSQKEYKRAIFDLGMAKFDDALAEQNRFGRRYVDAEINIIKEKEQHIRDSYKRGLIDYKEFTDSMNAIAQSAYDSRLAMYQAYADGVRRLVEKENVEFEKKLDGYEKEKEGIETVASMAQSYADERIAALQKENEERDKALERQKAEAEFERANSQKTKQVYVEGKGYVFQSDSKAVSDAQKNLDDLKRQHKLDEEIESWEEYKKKWQELVDAYTKGQDEMTMAALLGENWRDKLASKDESDMAGLASVYDNASFELDSEAEGSTANKLKNNQDLLTELGYAMDDVADEYSTYEGLLDDVAAFEGANYEGRLAMMRTWVSESKSELEALRKSYEDLGEAAEAVANISSGSALDYKSRDLAGAEENLQPSLVLQKMDGTIVDFKTASEELANAFKAYAFNPAQDVLRQQNEEFVRGVTEMAQNVVNNNNEHKQITINMGGVNLPNVQNADQFANDVEMMLMNRINQNLSKR